MLVGYKVQGKHRDRDEVTKQMALQGSRMTTGLKVTHKQEGKEGGKDSQVKCNRAIIFFGSFLFHPAFYAPITRLMFLSLQSPSKAFEIHVCH